MIRAALILFAFALPHPVWGDSFTRVETREAFLAALGEKTLHFGMFGIRLDVRADGTIKGSAMGWDVTGTWNWQDGYFCREMDWSGTPVPFNCQLVEQNGDELRFTVDKGAGDSARFALR